MRPAPIASVIRIAARVELDLKAGERVSVQVLKPLAEGKWAVGLQGRVFPATATLALTAGDRLEAVVQRAGRQILLRLASAGPPSPAPEELPRLLPRLIAHVFAAEGQPLDAAGVERVRERLRRLPGPAAKSAHSLAIAMAKGIDPDSPGLSELLSLVLFEDNRDRGSYRRRPLPRRRKQLVQAVKAELGGGAEGREGALALFNSLSAAAGTWVAIPFSFRSGAKDLQGTVRLLYVGSRPTRLALEVRGGSHWGFHLSEGRRLSVFCDRAQLGGRASAALPSLRAKLQSHGVEVDDSISDSRLFDGYSAAGAAGVDLLG